MTNSYKGSGRHGFSWSKRLLYCGVFVISLYGALVAASALVFCAPWSVLRHMPDLKRDQLISTGVFSLKSHPLYRDWLQHYVRKPDAPVASQYFMDTYYAYGLDVLVTPDEAPSDFLGFPNSISPHDAKVLFVGDSFCVGASVGSKRAPAATFAALSGASVYNGGNGGYGLAQYIAIIKKLTSGLPPEQRFTGKDVVVMCYLGNDFNADVVQNESRKALTDDALSWILKLGPLRAWVNYLSLSFERPMAAGDTPVGVYAPIPMQCQTEGGLPFAWHPSYASLIIPDNITRPLPAVDKLIGQLAALKSLGLRIKVVLVPAGIQVVSGDIDWDKVSAANAVAADTAKIADAINGVAAIAMDMFAKHGLEAVDLTGVLRSSPERCLYYQPADTHCTALGYEAIGKAIHARWPELGRPDGK